MAGIQERDIWQAADALLLEGARPTIDRIREKLGRGSPNTVSKHLETWFKHLGGRIQDPGAFSVAPDVPDPVTQVARHLWEVAQAESRRDVDQRVQEGLAAAVKSVQAAEERARIAEAAAFDAAATHSRVQADAADLRSEIERLRLALSAAEARLEEARSHGEELRARLQQADESLASVRNTARRDVETAQERAAAVERRAMLEIDAERTARTKSERRAAAIEEKLQATIAEAQATQAKHIEQLAKAEAENGRLTTGLASAEAQAQEGRRQAAALSSELEEMRSQARSAQSQFELAERVIAAVRARPAQGSTAQRASKRTRSA